MVAVTVLFTVLFSVILTFVHTGCLELSFRFCTFLIYVRVLFRFLFNKLGDDDDVDEDELGKWGAEHPQLHTRKTGTVSFTFKTRGKKCYDNRQLC